MIYFLKNKFDFIILIILQSKTINCLQITIHVYKITIHVYNLQQSNMASAATKCKARTAAQKNGTIYSKCVAEEKRYKESSKAQKALQAPKPLSSFAPTINHPKLAADRKREASLVAERKRLNGMAAEHKRLANLSQHRSKEMFVSTFDLRKQW